MSHSRLSLTVFFWLQMLFPSIAFTAFDHTLTIARAPAREKRLFSASPHQIGHHDDDDVVVVALTREEGNNEKLRKELVSQLGDGAAVALEELPCIAHADGDDFAQLAPALIQGGWDYVAVTSPEAARVLGQAWADVVVNRDNEDESSRPLPRVAAVGKATQIALEQLGIPVHFCPSKATAETLVEELPSTGQPTTTLLYPASAKAATTLQDGLMARGFSVTRMNTYDTVTSTWKDSERQVATKVKVACFGSPSAVEGWLKNTNNNKQVMAACIGETSAKACRKYEWQESHIFFPEKPGVPGWANAVKEALATVQVAHASRD